jgi:pimeloyl-ACP methyl ester carboxylesterase
LKRGPGERLVLLAISLLGGCGPPAPRVTADEAAAIPRASYRAPAGYEINYLRGGDASARSVIFVHGTPGAADGWAEFLADVPNGFEYIAVDRPGFGRSGPAGAVVSLEEQASALAPLLVEKGGGWPILVGHSLGGPIVARLAADQPDKIGALIILAGSLDPDLERVHWAQPVGEWPGVRAMLPRALRNANLELMALEPHLRALTPLLDRIECPVLIVHGTADKLVPYANVRFMQARLSSAELEVTTIRDGDHFLPWNRQQEISRAIVRAAEASRS